MSFFERVWGDFAVFSLLGMSESESFRKREAGQDASLAPGVQNA